MKKGIGLLVILLVLLFCAAAAADTVIDADAFPDGAFRDYVSRNLDRDGDGTLSDGELKAVTSIQCAGLGILDLTGIGLFSELTELDCCQNGITKLDLGGNPALQTLSAYSNGLEVLEIFGNTGLTSLSCSNNQLSALELPRAEGLVWLDVSSNPLRELEIGGSPLLVRLTGEAEPTDYIYWDAGTAVNWIAPDQTAYLAVDKTDTVRAAGEQLYPGAGADETETPEPTAAPTEIPTEVMTEAPTAEPTEAPTVIPTEVPTEAPTVEPTEAPTEAPTAEPTELPAEEAKEKQEPVRMFEADVNGMNIEGIYEFDVLRSCRFYALDTLQDGCYPLVGHFAAMDMFDGSGQDETVNVMDIELTAGDDPAEQQGYLTRLEDGQLVFNTWKMRKPGTTEWNLLTESRSGSRNIHLMINVIDQKDDPEFHMPESSIEVFAEPGEKVKAYELDRLCTDLYIFRASFSGANVENGMISETSYDEPGTYNFFLKLEWGTFFTMTEVTLHVYPKDEWAGKDETVVVKNFSELEKAINETRANTILISAKYRHGKVAGSYPALTIEKDRKVIIAPENGAGAVIDGGLRFEGTGSVVLDRVAIEPKEGCGLNLDGGIHVTAGTVHGASSASDSGCPAVIAFGTTLKIDEAVGGDGKNGIGGDGIYAVGEGADVEVRSARGGSASNGFGGSGVAAVGGARVTVTGEAAGGDGPGAPGKAILQGLDGEIDVRGTARDGRQTESPRPVNTEEITSYALLQHALRSGKTEIELSPKYRNTEKNWEKAFGSMPLFTAGDKTVKITGPGSGRTIRPDQTFYVCCGSWQFSGMDLNPSNRDIVALCAAGSADVEWNGNITSASNCAVASGPCRLTVNGDLNGKGDCATLVAKPFSEVTVNGNVSTAKDLNNIYVKGANVRMNGNIKNTTGKNRPAIYVLYGTMDLIGNLDVRNGCAAYIHEGGQIHIQGNVTVPTKEKYALYARIGLISVEGSITAPYPGDTEASGESLVLLNGERVN